MTRDDIISMAREAGLDGYGTPLPAIERFAALVAAAEREACAKVCDVEAAFCGSHKKQDAVGSLCADAIRARGETK